MGWGAWSIESGWVNSWIASVLAMRERGDSLYNEHGREGMQAILPDLLDEMQVEYPLDLTSGKGSVQGKMPGAE